MRSESLEQARYVRRGADPANRRRLSIAPTDLVAERDAKVFGRLIRSTAALVAGYSDAELVTIRDFPGRTQATIAAR